MSTNTKKEIYQIPGKMVGYHLPEINTILDIWSSSLFVSLEDWKSTVFDIGIMDYAPKHRVTSWIIDTSGAEVFSLHRYRNSAKMWQSKRFKKKGSRDL